MSDSTSPSPRRLRVSLDSWAVLAATLFVILVLVGLLPAIPR